MALDPTYFVWMICIELVLCFVLARGLVAVTRWTDMFEANKFDWLKLLRETRFKLRQTNREVQLLEPGVDSFVNAMLGGKRFRWLMQNGLRYWAYFKS